MSSGATFNEDSLDEKSQIEQELERLDTIATRAMNRAYDAEKAAKELEERVAHLEAENKRLRSRLEGSESKQEKIAALVEFAQNKRAGEDVVAISREELMGVYGCSRRYSYTLVDADEGLPDEYVWILSDTELNETQYGNLEKEAAKKRIGIDFEGVHTVGCPVNRFITESDLEEGQQ